MDYIIALYKQSIVSMEKMSKIAQFVFTNYSYIAQKADAIKIPAYSLISVVDILAIICQESGSQLINGKQNKDIIGDGISSRGIMQIQKAALIDVNKNFGYTYTFDDILKNPEINVLIGAGYLQLCMKQASKEKAKDIKILGYRKYNAGIKRATEKNSISKLYAESVSVYRNQLLTFQNLV